MYITIPETKRVNVIKIKITVQCKDCGSEWASYLNMDGSLKNGWNLCRKCSLENKFNSVVEDSILNDKVETKEKIENDITRPEGIN